MATRLSSLASCLLALLIVVGLAANPALAQTTANWNDGNGNWTTASDWNCPTSATHCVPNNSGSTFYDVFINSPWIATVTLDESVNVDALDLGKPLSVAATPAQTLNIGVSGAPQTLALGSSNADAGFGVAPNGTINVAGRRGWDDRA
ncbi:MAG: hypothetical protein ACRD11_02070 [Terriglobia bacterium]